MIDFADTNELKARIKVFGVGGAGGNALNNMIQQNLGGVMFYAANTDAQALNSNLAPVKMQLGTRLTGGLGAGGTPEVGHNAAMEDQSAIAEQMQDADMVFVTAGMGGGTGTGAAPVVAHLGRDAGALTVGIVTKPFAFEGRRRSRNAERGLEALADEVDTLIVIPNDRLLDIADPKMTMVDAFRVADQVLYDAVKSISDIIVTPGLINVDFADVKSIMSCQGRALMGTGSATGDKRAIEAAQMAISSPLLEDANIDGAMGILINVTGGPDMTLHEVNEAAMLIEDAADPDANIIWGSVVDETMSEQIKITVVATGFESARTGRVAGSVATASEREHVYELIEARNRKERATEPEPEPEADAPAAEAATATAGPAVAPPTPSEPQTRQVGREVRRDPPTRAPKIYNPFSPPTRSEYDTPTFARRGRSASAPQVTTSAPTPSPTREWRDEEPSLL